MAEGLGFKFEDLGLREGFRVSGFGFREGLINGLGLNLTCSPHARPNHNSRSEMCSSSEEGSYLRLIHLSMT